MSTQPKTAVTPVSLPAGRGSEKNLHLRATPFPAGSGWRGLWAVLQMSAKAWLSHRAASKGAALALYTLFSLAPMLVLVLAVASVFFDADTVRSQLLAEMSALIGSQGADAVKAIIAGAHQRNDGMLASAISGVIVLVSATSAFAELKDSLDELWEVPQQNGSGVVALLRERLLSFGLLLVIALMLMASLAVSAGLSALGATWRPDAASQSLTVLSQVGVNLVAFGVVMLLFAIIFKYLPATRIAWRDVLLGAGLTAWLFMLGKFAIGLYLGHGNFSSAYGAAGSIVALITWIYYSAQIFFFGALFTHDYAFMLGSKRRPATAPAPPRSTTG